MNNEARVAIITGGGQGIGKGIARHFVRSGMKVVTAEIDAEAGKETEAEYTPLGLLSPPGNVQRFANPRAGAFQFKGRRSKAISLG
jgi:NAD(P)-dependent dehydrogenase (short-subunit alcohol dehydrogenase family)